MNRIEKRGVACISKCTVPFINPGISSSLTYARVTALQSCWSSCLLLNVRAYLVIRSVSFCLFLSSCTCTPAARCDAAPVRRFLLLRISFSLCESSNVIKSAVPKNTVCCRLGYKNRCPNGKDCSRDSFAQSALHPFNTLTV